MCMSSKTLVSLTNTSHESTFVVAKLPEGLQLGCQGGCSANRNCSLRDWLIPPEEEEEIAHPKPNINFITYHSTLAALTLIISFFENARGIPPVQLKRELKTKRKLSTVIMELSLTTYYISFHAVVEISGEFIHQTHNNQLDFKCTNAIHRICDLYQL